MLLELPFLIGKHNFSHAISYFSTIGFVRLERLLIFLYKNELWSHI